MRVYLYPTYDIDQRYCRGNTDIAMWLGDGVDNHRAGQ